jgi:hypothetical protein
VRTMRSYDLSCTICGKEDAAVDNLLDCNHGPVGPKCKKEILEGNRKCQQCTAPPKYMLLEAEAETQRASSDSHPSSHDALLEDLDEWVNSMRIDSDSDE